MKSLNLKLFTMAMAAVLPALANTLTSLSDSTGVHVNHATPWDQGNNVVQITATPNGSTLTGNDQFVNDGLASVGGNLASFSDANGEHVFYIGWDWNVYEVLYPPAPNTGFKITNLTNVTSSVTSPGKFPAPFASGGPPQTTGLTACSGAAGNFVFYVDDIGHLIVISSTSGTPSNLMDLTATFGGPAVAYGSSLVAFCGQTWGQQVFYIDTNYNVNTFYVVPWLCHLSAFRFPICGPGWVNSNLTAAAGAPAAFVPPSTFLLGPSVPLTGFQDSFGTHIFYVASNQNINQLWLQPSGTWSNQNVMPYEPACLPGRCSPPPPLPAANTALSSLADPQGHELVFYIDANRGITELLHNPNLTAATLGNGWFYESPTTAAGVNLSNGVNLGLHLVDSGCSMMQLTSLVDNTGAQRVYYVDASGDLIQLLLGSTGWSFLDLNEAAATTGTEPVASGCALGNQ